MRKALWIIGLLVMVLGPAGPAAHAQDRHEDLLRQFSAYRSTLERWPIKRQAPATPLPLDLEKATNWAAAKSSVPGTAYDLLRRNAFVVFDQGRQDRVEKFYDSLKHQGLPLFITSDSVLHLYHVQFDETLASVEEDQFFNLLTTFSEKMADESLQRYREAFDQANPTSIRARITEEESRPLRRSVESLRRCTAYFWVAHKLLAHDAEPNAEVPDAVRDIVAQELDLIEAHAGFAKSPIFTYDEDYSQYVPRGHYTRSDRLKKYFRAMMWFGRMTFLAKGRTEAMPDALVSDEEARIQTLAAFEIMEMLPAVKMKVPLPFPDEGNYRRRIRPTEDTTAQAVWERIYAVTAYYVGFADDLTSIEYRQALGTLAIEKSMGLSALVAHRWFELQKAIAGLRTPEIYSGLGNMEGPPPQIATEADWTKHSRPRRACV